MKSEHSSDGAILFLTGFALGAAVALLAAPQSGKRTRRAIARKAEDAQEHLEDLGEDLIAKGRELVDRGRAAAEAKVSELS